MGPLYSQWTNGAEGPLYTGPVADGEACRQGYAHLVPGYLQAQITRLKLTGFASPLLPAAANDEGPTEAADEEDQGSREGELERETGIEPATLSLGS